MISLNYGNFNTDIEAYNKLVANLEVGTISCPYCHHASMVRHGYYTRYINISGKHEEITILRIRCKTCGRTHAVIPSFVVPYLHHSIEQLQTMLVAGKVDENSTSIEYETKLIRKIKKRWMPMIISLGFQIKHKLLELVFLASHKFRLCFMQIHCGFYKVQSRIHTT